MSDFYLEANFMSQILPNNKKNGQATYDHNRQFELWIILIDHVATFTLKASLRQCCDYSVILAQKGVGTPIWGDTIVFNDNIIASFI